MVDLVLEWLLEQGRETGVRRTARVGAMGAEGHRQERAVQPLAVALQLGLAQVRVQAARPPEKTVRPLPLRSE